MTYPWLPRAEMVRDCKEENIHHFCESLLFAFKEEDAEASFAARGLGGVTAFACISACRAWAPEMRPGIKSVSGILCIFKIPSTIEMGFEGSTTSPELLLSIISLVTYHYVVDK